MSADLLKMLALLFCGVVGYFYAWRKRALEERENVDQLIKGEQNKHYETEKLIANTPQRDLIRYANERLRKRRDAHRK